MSQPACGQALVLHDVVARDWLANFYALLQRSSRTAVSPTSRGTSRRRFALDLGGSIEEFRGALNLAVRLPITPLRMTSQATEVRHLTLKPTPETRPFWEAAKRRELRIQQCHDCGAHYFYPRPLCPYCLSRNVAWVRCSGRGRLHTYVINHRPPRNYPASGPYIIGIVELEEGPRLMTNIVGVEPDPKALRCDMPVEVVFEDIDEHFAIPKFRPVS